MDGDVAVAAAQGPGVFFLAWTFHTLEGRGCAVHHECIGDGSLSPGWAAIDCVGVDGVARLEAVSEGVYVFEARAADVLGNAERVLARVTSTVPGPPP